MQFNNVQNECVKTEDGRTVWLSRSVAVCNTIMIECLGDVSVLLVKRGPGCPDEIGKWVLPCGYLDHNESLRMGAVRELYEETGLDLFSILDKPDAKIVYENYTDDDQMPWYINQSMNSRQNITMHYGLYIKYPEHYTFPSVHTNNCEDGEVETLEFVNVNKLYTLDIGFNHYPRIQSFIKNIVKPRLTWKVKLFHFLIPSRW